MAFNPFHKFRKHQKVIFACLTIMCMLSFVACSGFSSGGDVAHWLQTMIMGKVRETDVDEQYGKTVSQRELYELLRQREIANIYMASATEAALRFRSEELRPPGSQQITPEILQKMFRDPEVIQLQQRLQAQPYFGGSLSPEGLLDFKIWLHQAGLLRIPELSRAQIQQEVDRLTLTSKTSKKFTSADSGKIESAFSRTPRFKSYYTPDTLLKALNNEFRVRMAQEAVMGLEPNTYIRMPAPVTPEEFWAFFKENQTRLDINLLAVKAEDFLAEVKGQPTDKELKDLYDKNKGQEYAPESKEPGFRQPRRVQVEWVSGRSDSDNYKKAAADYRALVQAAMVVTVGAGSRAALGGVSPAVQLSVPIGLDVAIPAGKDPFGKDTTLLAEYDNLKWGKFQAASYTKMWRWPPFPLQDANLKQPANVAAAVGQAFGAASTDISPVTSVSTFLASATAREIEAREARGIAWVLSGAQPTPVMTAAIGAYLTPQADFLPLATVRDQVEDRLLKALGQDLLISNLKAVQKEVEEKGKDKDKKALREYLEKAVKDYNLQTGKTAEPRDQFKNKIDDDPGMKAMKEAYLHPAPPGDPQGKGFPRLFFNETKPYAVERFPSTRFRAPDEDIEWKSGPESFIYWKTDDQAPKTLPLTDPEVKREVERAWRLEKARELAKKAADKLAVELSKDKGDIKKLRDFAEKEKKELISLPAISKRMQTPSFRPEVAYTYEPPRIAEDKVPYAGPDFAAKLLTLKDKEKGATLVQADQPEGTYYVAVLVDKKEPSWDSFMDVYRGASTDSVRRDPMLEIFEFEKRQQYMKDVMEMLRKEARANVSDAKRQTYAENMKKYEGTFTTGEAE